jgi:hypothetical protein
LHGFSFSTDVKVRFAETDAQGIVHNANYLVWFEVARVEYLERHAGGYQRLRDLGVEALVLEDAAADARPDLARGGDQCGGAGTVDVVVVVTAGFGFFGRFGPTRMIFGVER